MARNTRGRSAAASASQATTVLTAAQQTTAAASSHSQRLATSAVEITVDSQPVASVSSSPSLLNSPCPPPSSGTALSPNFSPPPTLLTTQQTATKQTVSFPPATASIPPPPLPAPQDSQSNSQQYPFLQPQHLSPNRTHGRTPGSSNWTTVDTHLMLDCVSAILPRGSADWYLVAERFNAGRSPLTAATTQRIKDKFHKLKSQRGRTGDPSMPSDVRRARDIAWQIQSRTSSMPVEQLPTQYPQHLPLHEQTASQQNLAGGDGCSYNDDTQEDELSSQPSTPRPRKRQKGDEEAYFSVMSQMQTVEQQRLATEQQRIQSDNSFKEEMIRLQRQQMEQQAELQRQQMQQQAELQRQQHEFMLQMVQMLAGKQQSPQSSQLSSTNQINTD